MKKTLISTLTLLLCAMAYAADTVFDSMDKAIEIKLSPAIAPSTTTTSTPKTATPAATATKTATTAVNQQSIQEQKFNIALTNLDDAQVELRQELSDTTAKYNEALAEKKRAIANCKAIKKEIRTINKKMKNVDKSKKMINANLDANAKQQ